MSNIDKQALREAAEKATPGEWWIDSHGMAMVAHQNDNTFIVFVTDGEQMGRAIRHEDTGNLSHWRNDNDASFIAAANPATVLALLDELEAKDKRIAELESDNAYIRNRHKELDLLIGKNILVMQAAIIEWQGTGDARKGLAWIYNTLFGPGELPDESEKDAQAYFDRKYAPLDEELMNLHRWFWEQSEAERAAAAGKGEA